MYIADQNEVQGLQNFAAVLENMSDDDMLKFRILAEQAKGFYEVTQLVDTLQYYDVDSTFELTDFAWRMLIDEYGFSEDDPLLEHIDLTGFGNEIAKEAGYKLTRYGAVLANDDGMQYGNLTAMCDQKISLGNYHEYSAHDYPYSFEEIASTAIWPLCSKSMAAMNG